MRFIDLFAGIGGFHYGITRAKKAECVYSNEWDKYANSVYRKHFGECDQRDIRTVPADTIPDFDLLCGGFPCQSFSIAGKRGGFEDTRGTLFFEIARIARIKRPRYLFLENVKGLLSHDQGNTFATIITAIDELGYDCQWQVLNSKNFGVPQNRERVFIVGHLRGTPRPKVFPIGENRQATDELPRHIAKTLTGRYEVTSAGTYIGESEQYAQTGRQDIQQEGNKPNNTDSEWRKAYPAIRDITSKKIIAPRRIRDLQKSESFITSWQLETNGKVSEKELEILETWRNYHRGKFYGDKSVGNGMSQQEIEELLHRSIDKEIISLIKKGYFIRKNDGRLYTQTARGVAGKVGFAYLTTEDSWSPTITASTMAEQAHFDGLRIRRLTPIECERLQGFTDDWTKYGADGELISDTQRYKMCGNAVTVNVIEAIAQKLL